MLHIPIRPEQSGEKRFDELQNHRELRQSVLAVIKGRSTTLSLIEDRSIDLVTIPIV
jgi:hypothetical protein